MNKMGDAVDGRAFLGGGGTCGSTQASAGPWRLQTAMEALNAARELHHFD